MTVHIHKNGKVVYPGGSAVPQVGSLFIDMLTMTLAIPEHLHGATIAGFQKAEAQSWGIKMNKTAYKHNLKLSPDNEGKAIIQCSPQTPTYNFFRIEFNPAHTNLDNLKTQLEHIIPGGYANLLTNGIVTRIDFTVDVSYLDATDIIATHAKSKIEKHYAKNGSIESKYLGSSASKKQILLYDKVAQMKSKKSKVSNLQLPTHKLLRIEHKLTNSGLTLKGLEPLQNPFQDLTLRAFLPSKFPKPYDPQWPLFLSSCRFEGVDKALSYFNDVDRAYYKNRLATEGKSDWWNPENVWLGLSAALKVITSPKGYTPSQNLIS